MNVELITFFCKFFYSTNDSVLERMKKENNLKEGGDESRGMQDECQKHSS
jgi:hypothetical protein